MLLKDRYLHLPINRPASMAYKRKGTYDNRSIKARFNWLVGYNHFFLGEEPYIVDTKTVVERNNLVDQQLHGRQG